ncbi:MAG: sodium-dependent transporter [Planctomycetota bacterium]|jgi:NSS family neurotransmitter:Na+ symporter
MALNRDRWSGNTVFILAAIGSAIGLGNIWRFPFKCYEYGGGAYLVAYIFALLTAGIPLLIMEFGLGDMTQRGAPGAFHKIRKGLEWMGWWPILVGFVLTCYYVVVMGWCVDYLWFAAKADYPEKFFSGFLGATGSPLKWGGMNWPVVLGMLISWMLIVLAIWKGATTVSKVVWVTVLVPWALLLVFVVQGLRMDGAVKGVLLYVVPKWKQLLNPQLWVAAYGQVFYSLSVGFGIMIAYSSFLPKKTNLVKNAFIIGVGDALTAIVGGFAVFGVLGSKIHAAFPDIAVAKLTTEQLGSIVKGGPGLVFETYPEIIKSLPAAQLFGVLFFLMLITLAVDSAFSLTESVCAGIRDKWGLSHKTANFSVAGVGILIGLVYCTGAGLHWLDLVDKYLEYFGLGVVCLVEVIIIAAFLKTGRIRQYLNANSGFKVGIWWDICLLVITPIMLLIVIVMGAVELIKTPYSGYPQKALWIGGWGLFAALPLIAFAISKVRGKGDVDTELTEDASHDLDADSGDGPGPAHEELAPDAPPAEAPPAL